jgi:hypothetical protein
MDTYGQGSSNTLAHLRKRTSEVSTFLAKIEMYYTFDKPIVMCKVKEVN